MCDFVTTQTATATRAGRESLLLQSAQLSGRLSRQPTAPSAMLKSQLQESSAEAWHHLAEQHHAHMSSTVQPSRNEGGYAFAATQYHAVAINHRRRVSSHAAVGLQSSTHSWEASDSHAALPSTAPPAAMAAAAAAALAKLAESADSKENQQTQALSGIMKQKIQAGSSNAQQHVDPSKSPPVTWACCNSIAQDHIPAVWQPGENATPCYSSLDINAGYGSRSTGSQRVSVNSRTPSNSAVSHAAHCQTEWHSADAMEGVHGYAGT